MQLYTSNENLKNLKKSSCGYEDAFYRKLSMKISNTQSFVLKKSMPVSCVHVFNTNSLTICKHPTYMGQVYILQH